MRVLVATNGRGGAHCMKFSVTHHAGQATTAQLGQRLSPLNFRLFALPLICEMESSKITIKEFQQRGAVAMCGFMRRCLWAALFRLMAMGFQRLCSQTATGCRWY